MRKVFIVLAALFFILGTVTTITDYQETSAKAKVIQNYPVVKASELDEYLAKEAAKVVVTDISISGTQVTDPKKLLTGKYYYIQAYAESYMRDSDGNSDWYDERNYNYEVLEDDLRTDVNPDQPLQGSQIFYCPKLATIYPKNVNKKHLKDGDLRYTFRGLEEGDTLTALMTVGDGKAELETLLERDEENYLVGDEQTYYDHVNDFLVGDSFLFLILGVILACIFLFLAHVWKGKSPIKRGAEQIAEMNEEHKIRKQQYKELAPDLKKRFWKLRISGSVMTVAGLAFIICCYQTTSFIVIGTIILILGIAAFNSALPSSYNEGSDVVHMITLSKAHTIEEFYEAF